MKTILLSRRPIKFGILFSAIMLINAVAFGATYTAVASGNWSSTTTWGGTAPSLNNTADQITIPASINVVMDNNVTLNGATSQITVTGTLSSVTNNIFIITTGTLAGTGTVSADSLNLGAGATLLFSGSLTAKRMATTALNLQGGTSLMINQTLNLLSGTVSVGSGGTLTLAANTTIIMSGGQLTQSGGSVGLSSSYNVVYENGATVTGLELLGPGLNNVTVNVGGSNTLALGTDLTVNGLLKLSSGTLALSGHHLTIAGDVAASGTGTIYSTVVSNITITAAINMSGALMFANTSGVNNLTVNVGSGYYATISGPVTVNGTLTLTSGILKLQSAMLTITGDIAASTAGTISSTASSTIVVHTATSPSGGLSFTAGSNMVDTLSINIVNNGSVVISSDLTINGQLKFTAGHVNIGNNKLTIGNTGTITGAGVSSHVITGTNGSLGITTGIASSSMFPVGTSSAYFPATAQINSGSSSRVIRIGVSPHVYINGTSGADLSATQPVVDATWDITSDVTSNMDLNLQLMWAASSEVNGFMHSAAYISHYTGVSWDAGTIAAATTVSGMFSLTRTNITSLSPYAVFDQRAATGINDVNNISEITIYPNPASENISINIADDSGNGVVNVDIVNISGQTVGHYEITETNTLIPVDQLPNGSYFIKLHNDKMNSVKRFIKM